MYSIGDSVLYGANGVMSIVDIRDEQIGDTPREYYVLKPVCVRSDTFTFVPVDNEALVSMMYPLITVAELDEIFSLAVAASDCEWPADNRRRSDMFKKILESGNRVNVLVMIRTIQRAGKLREREGKKNFLADENAMKRAEKLMVSEISVVLGISEEDAASLIKERLEV